MWVSRANRSRVRPVRSPRCGQTTTPRRPLGRGSRLYHHRSVHPWCSDVRSSSGRVADTLRRVPPAEPLCVPRHTETGLTKHRACPPSGHPAIAETARRCCLRPLRRRAQMAGPDGGHCEAVRNSVGTEHDRGACLARGTFDHDVLTGFRTASVPATAGRLWSAVLWSVTPAPEEATTA